MIGFDLLYHEDAKTTSIYLNASVQELSDSMRRFGSGSQPLHDVAQASNQERPTPVQQSAGALDKSLVN